MAEGQITSLVAACRAGQSILHLIKPHVRLTRRVVRNPGAADGPAMAAGSAMRSEAIVLRRGLGEGDLFALLRSGISDQFLTTNSRRSRSVHDISRHFRTVFRAIRRRLSYCFSWKTVVLPERIELSTSPLPRECSTPELRQQAPEDAASSERPGAWQQRCAWARRSLSEE